MEEGQEERKGIKKMREDTGQIHPLHITNPHLR